MKIEDKTPINMLEYETKYWDKGYTLVAGIDEAGRGPLGLQNANTFIP